MANVLQIYNKDNILRRVPTNPSYIKPDGTINSYSFRKRKGENGISVNLERLSSYTKTTMGSSNFRVLKLNVGTIRNLINDGLDVIHDQIPNNEAHSLITGNVSKSKQKQLVKHSTEIFEEE